MTRKSTEQLGLDTFIAKPVQRILKYPLFFRELIKASKPEEECYNHLQEAQNAINAVAKYLNDHKNNKENREKLQELEQIIKGFKVRTQHIYILISKCKMKKKLYVPGRVFYREGVLAKLSPTRNKFQDRRVYLFNDFLMYCKEKSKDQIEYRGDIPTLYMLLKDLPDTKGFLKHRIYFSFNLNIHKKKLEQKNAFLIKRTDNHRVYAFYCKTEYEKAEWIKDLNKIIDDITPKQDPSSKVAKKLILGEWHQETSSPIGKKSYTRSQSKQLFTN